MIISRLPSGGGGKKSLILPDNANVDIYSYDNKLVVKWTKPSNSEVQIGKYNLYWVQSDAKPTSLKQFTNKVEVSVSATEQAIANLTNGKIYWVALESVSVEGYENASLRKANSMNVGVPYFLAIIVSANSPSTYMPLYSNDGKTWKEANYRVSNVTNPVRFSYNRFTRNAGCDFAKDGTFVVGSTAGSGSSYYTVTRISDYKTSTNVIDYQAGSPSCMINADGKTIISDKNNAPHMRYILDGKTNAVSYELEEGKGAEEMFYANGKFLFAVSESTAFTIYHKLYSSDDGISKFEFLCNTNSIRYFTNQIVYWNGFYVSNTGFYSMDLKTWIQFSELTSLNDYFRVLFTFNGKLYAVSYNTSNRMYVISADKKVTYLSNNPVASTVSSNPTVVPVEKNGILVWLGNPTISYTTSIEGGTYTNALVKENYYFRWLSVNTINK